MRFATTAFLLVIFLTSCATAPKTEITIRDSKLSGSIVNSCG